MIPRTIKVAAAVKSTFSSTQLLNYGNVILNGYLTTASGVATAGAEGGIATVTISAAGTNYTNGSYTGVYLGGTTGTFGYANVTVAGGAVTAVTITSAGQNFTVGQVLTLGGIPRTASGTTATVTVATVNTRSVRPSLKGWTTNYSSYYTQLPPVASPYTQTYPGMDAGGFEFEVTSFKPPTGSVGSIGFAPFIGQGYTDGFYTGVATSTGPYGSGATLNIQVVGGQVVACTINNAGTGYPVGTTLSVAGGAIGPGTGFYVVVTSTSGTVANGQPLWSQRPINAQSQVNSLFPLQGGGGGWIYPVGNSPVPPPIDTL